MRRMENAMSETATVTIPDVMQDEAGDLWFAAGHWEPAVFLLGVIASAVRDCGPEDAFEHLGYYFDTVPNYSEFPAVVAAKLRDVRAEWYRPDPNDEEQMHPCKSTDPDAQPFMSLVVG